MLTKEQAEKPMTWAEWYASKGVEMPENRKNPREIKPVAWAEMEKQGKAIREQTGNKYTVGELQEMGFVTYKDGKMSFDMEGYDKFTNKTITPFTISLTDEERKNTVGQYILKNYHGGEQTYVPNDYLLNETNWHSFDEQTHLELWKQAHQGFGYGVSGILSSVGWWIKNPKKAANAYFGGVRHDIVNNAKNGFLSGAVFGALDYFVLKPIAVTAGVSTTLVSAAIAGLAVFGIDTKYNSLGQEMYFYDKIRTNEEKYEETINKTLFDMGQDTVFFGFGAAGYTITTKVATSALGRSRHILFQPVLNRAGRNKLSAVHPALREHESTNEQ